MAQAQRAYSEGKSTPLHKGLQTIKEEIDRIVSSMSKNTAYTPERADLDALSSRAVQLIQKYHPKIPANQKTLLMAVIDLTEIPVMHPKMQRVAFQTALKDASKNIQTFLNSGF